MKAIRDTLENYANWPNSFKPAIYFDRTSAVAKFTDIANASKTRIIQFIDLGQSISQGTTKRVYKFDVLIWANASFDDLTDTKHDEFIQLELVPYMNEFFNAIFHNNGGD